MAKQTGVVILKGTIGGISFYKTRDGHMARGKGGVEGNRNKNDPAFQRTRENGAEFGRAGHGSKILRDAVRVVMQNAKDRRVVGRVAYRDGESSASGCFPSRELAERVLMGRQRMHVGLRSSRPEALKYGPN